MEHSSSNAELREPSRDGNSIQRMCSQPWASAELVSHYALLVSCSPGLVKVRPEVLSRCSPQAQSTGECRTKWCGLGDLAQNYHDLGSETKIDKCCRSHDICPAKVRAHDSRYDLKNTDFYTKSHCECDRRLYECLKATRRATADTMGSFYFNILRVPCVDDVASSGQSEDRNSSTKKIFRKARKRYRR
uniref:phospholipase A2 n=1 Tax=Timema monikensis TaxID=170555 RepID=A0A7R9E924_9NEOP|nr:unnamed protein product [Timema monikensis]